MYFWGGVVIEQVKSVKKPWGGCSINRIRKKRLDTIWFLFYFCHHCFHVLEQVCTWWFLIHGNTWFPNKSRYTVQLNLKDAAHISISHTRHLSVDHKCTSQRLQLQLCCCQSEGFGDGCAILWDRWDKTQCTSSTQARGLFQCSFAHFTNFRFWMAWQIGFGNGLLCLFF